MGMYRENDVVYETTTPLPAKKDTNLAYGNLIMAKGNDGKAHFVRAVEDADGNFVLADSSSLKISTTNLDDVTTATNGAAVDISDFSKVTIYTNVSVNTGAVTVNVEVSADGTNWDSFDAEIFTATTGINFVVLTGYYPYVRTTTTTQSASTVQTIVYGKGA